MYTLWYLFHDPPAQDVVSFQHDLGYQCKYWCENKNLCATVSLLSREVSA